MTKRVVSGLVMLMTAVIAFDGSGKPAGRDADSVRIRALEEKLMAPCCYQTTLAEHHSEPAMQMKAEIAASVAQGKSDREIIDAYKEQYGARILAEPEGKVGVWLIAIPVLVSLLGLAAVVLLIGRWRSITGT